MQIVFIDVVLKKLELFKYYKIKIVFRAMFTLNKQYL